MREDAACPGRRTSKGELRDVKRQPARNGRPARVEGAARLRVSHAAGVRSRSGRQTHSDRLVEDEARGALRPWCPAGEAINPSRRTRVQREKRSTPTRRTGVQRAKDQRQLRPAGLDRGRRATSNPPVRSALPAKDQRQTPLQQHSLLGDSTVMPVQQGDHAPRFLWRETLEKAKQ